MAFGPAALTPTPDGIEQATGLSEAARPERPAESLKMRVTAEALNVRNKGYDGSIRSD